MDDERFARQADAFRGQRSEIRRQWGIADDALCILFCGKFIKKKRPFDLIEAARLLLTDNTITDNRARNAHLLFVGSGELGTPTVPKYVLAAVIDEERSFQRRDE